MAEEYNNHNNGVIGGTKWWDSSPTTRSSPSSSSTVFSHHQSLQMMGLNSVFRPILQDGQSIYAHQKPFPGAEPTTVKGFSLDQFSHSSSVDSCSQGGLASPTLLSPLQPSPAGTGIFQALMEPPMQSGYGYNQAAEYGNSDNLLGSAPNCNWDTTSSNKIHEEVPQFLKASNQAQFMNHIHSHGSFWNAVADPRPPSFLPPPLLAVPSFHNKLQHKNNMMAARNTSTGHGAGRKGGSISGSDRTSTTSTTSTGGATAKRPRNEASSTMPPFKVRKEKMGDRITALQQLVSPFGKTDTASVLSEAIECIKFLHEQVNVLSTPYLKSGASLQQQHQSHDKFSELESRRKDLRSRGLCLVPVSSTFPVTHEATVDFWTPAFGSTTFR